MKRLELLAPARDYDGGRAAADHGADAVYIGGPAFGARASAGNGIDDIARLVDYAHRFGVRVYAALNTVLADGELAEAERVAREVIAAGVDALIIQDMAYMRMGLAGVEFHASTQMCNATPEAVAFLGHAGFTRAVLERGLTLDEIRATGAASDIELECFVHGAICVGFSGRCFLSRSMDGGGTPRSGNRGDCMQACRLPYDLTDGDGRIVADFAGRPMRGVHLLSALDFDLSARLDDLVDAGVTSFKIEGRLKDIGYVKNVTAHYRRLLDELIARRAGFGRSSSGRTILDFGPDPRRSFTRGGTEWMLGGGRSQCPGRSGVPRLVSLDSPKATGAWVGDVVRMTRDEFELSGDVQLAAGDGICFFSGGELRGTHVNAMAGRTVRPNRMDGIAPGTRVFRNHDKVFENALANARTRRVVDVRATLSFDDEAVLLLTDEGGFSASARVRYDGQARDTEKMLATMRAQLAKTGDTIFNVAGIEIEGHTEASSVVDGLDAMGNAARCAGHDRSGTGIPFMPVSALNDLRRRATDALLEARLAAPPERHTAVEDVDFPYPATRVGSDANVTNRLAERFYRDHGVTAFDPSLELRRSLEGECVMVSAYCVRRALGLCGDRRELFLRRGAHTFRLDFDCRPDRRGCRMRLIKL